MYTTASFPAMFSIPGNLSLEATAFTRAAIRVVGNDHTVRDTWEKIAGSAFHEHGTMCDKQTLRVHYRQTRRGPTVVKFFYFVKSKHGDLAEWTCVGESGPRNHINAPMSDDTDIRWY